ncbi:Arginine/ornithine antiporter [Nymphon striatum]|nr:Arginine/ornithine antiporter [Nymphon striatum]
MPAALAAYGGISIFGWLFSAIGALLLATVFSRLSKLVRNKNGGPYVYTKEGLGDFAGFLVAWGYWISTWVANAAITIAFVSALTVFFPVLGTNALYAVILGLTTIWFLTWINSKGIRESGKLQVVTTLLKLIPLVPITEAFIDEDKLKAEWKELNYLSKPDLLASKIEYIAFEKILKSQEHHGTLEGGDVAWLNEKTLAVGHTYRTNLEGIRQLKALLAPNGVEVIVADLPHYRGVEDVFHLMSILSPVDKDLAVVYSPLMPIRFRNQLLDLGYKLIEVPEDEFESMGCNVLAVGPRKCVIG